MNASASARQGGVLADAGRRAALLQWRGSVQNLLQILIRHGKRVPDTASAIVGLTDIDSNGDMFVEGRIEHITCPSRSRGQSRLATAKTSFFSTLGWGSPLEFGLAARQAKLWSPSRRTLTPISIEDPMKAPYPAAASTSKRRRSITKSGPTDQDTLHGGASGDFYGAPTERAPAYLNPRSLCNAERRKGFRGFGLAAHLQ